MASNEQLEQLRRSLECSICLEQTTDPRALPCLHSYCEECLTRHMAEKGEHGMFSCPLCNTQYPIPVDGATGFKLNFFVANIGEILMKNDGICCDICKASGRDMQASFICIQCRKYFCRECSQAHSLHTNDHRVVSLEEVKNGQHMDEIRLHQKVYCSVHKEETLKLYCEQCEISVCLLCFTLNHNQHKVTDIGNAANSASRAMRDLLEPFRSVTQHYGKLCEKRQKVLQSLLQKQQVCKSEIEQLFCEFVAEVTRQAEVHKEKAFQQLDEQVQAAKKQAEAACDEAELKRGKFVSVLQYVNSILASAHDAEKLQQFREIRKRLENLDVDQIETQVKQTTFEVQPKKLEIPNLGVRVVPKLGNETISSKKIPTLVTNVAVSCKSPVHRVTPQPTVKERAQFQQTRRLMSHRMRESVGLRECMGLAASDVGLIVTNQYNKDVKVFYKNTLAFKKFELEQTHHKLQCPVDVTTNVHGDIFITDWGIHGVVKYNAEGRVVKVYPDVYKGEGYITCHKDKLVVADTAGGRVIFTDYNCKVHHQIDARTLGLSKFSPRYICTDENTGHLAVSERNPGRLHVIDCTRPAVINTYMYTHNVLHGVCVDQFGYTLVADSNNDQVILYTNARAHVLTPRGGVSFPTGVCVSAPGEVSVLQWNGEVKVFRYLNF